MRVVLVVLIAVGCASNPRKEREELAKLIQSRMDAANRLFEAGDYEGSLRVRKELLRRYPAHPLVHNHYFYLWLGDCYMRLGRYVDAWDAYGEAAKVAAAELEDARQKVLSAPNPQEAKRWRKLVDDRLRPGLAAAHRRLAKVLSAKKQWDAALKQIEYAITICPEDLRALYLRARILEKAGRDARGAWRGFLEAAKRAPEMDLAAYNIGEKEISEAEAKLGGSSK